MIAKKSAGRSFRGVVNYVIHDKDNRETHERAEMVGTNTPARTVGEFCQEFGALYKARARLGKPNPAQPVAHWVLSLTPGEKITPEKWREVAEGFLDKMGYRDIPFLAVRHTDTDNDHCHIITSRIKPDGHLVDNGQDCFRMMEAVKELEAEHGLKAKPGTPGGPAKKNQARQIFRYSITPTKQEAPADLAALPSSQRATLSKASQLLGADLSGSQFMRENLRVCFRMKDGATAFRFANNMTATLKPNGQAVLSAPNSAAMSQLRDGLGQCLTLTAQATAGAKPAATPGARAGLLFSKPGAEPKPQTAPKVAAQTAKPQQDKPADLSQVAKPWEHQPAQQPQQTQQPKAEKVEKASPLFGGGGGLPLEEQIASIEADLRALGTQIRRCDDRAQMKALLLAEAAKLKQLDALKARKRERPGNRRDPDEERKNKSRGPGW